MNKPHQLSADQLIAFNQELAALVRAGVPLERGLLALKGDKADNLSAFAGSIGARLERGESLQQVVAQDEAGLPQLYRAIVCAGLRGGRLAAALEGLTRTLRRVAELKRLMRAAAAYPLVVLTTAYLLFVLALHAVIPEMVAAYDEFKVPPTYSTRVLHVLSTTVAWWWPWPPLIFLAWLVYKWGSNRADVGQSNSRSPLGSMYRNGRLLTFSDLLALLIEHHVPLPEAIELAAAASGDRQLSATSQTFATRLRSGDAKPPHSFPPMLGFVLTTALSQADMVKALQKLSAIYERRARRDADWLRLYLPALLTIVAGGGAAIYTAMALMGPWFHILRVLGGPEYATSL